MFPKISLRRWVLWVGSLVTLGLALFLIYEIGIDPVLAWMVVLLPTAFGVVCAMQALRPPRIEHHTRWFVVFIAAGVIGSAAVLWQQHRTDQQAKVERAALQKQLDRILFQIRDVFITFQIDIPLDNPAVYGYRTRLEKCVREMIAAQQPRCGMLPNSIRVDGQPTNFTILSMSPSAEAYPRSGTEHVAFNLVEYVLLQFDFFQHRPTNEQLINGSINPDLTFAVNKLLLGPDNVIPDNPGKRYVWLGYDIKRSTLFMAGFEVPPDPTTWHSNGNVASVPDLAESALLMHPRLTFILLDLDKSDRGNNYHLNEDSATAIQIAHTVSIERVGLSLSNGRQFSFTKDQLAALKDINGFPLFIVSSMKEDSATTH
jgi:hypothetical protein